MNETKEMSGNKIPGPKSQCYKRSFYKRSCDNGVMILVERSDIEDINILSNRFTSDMNNGDLLLAVYPDWKHFRVFYKIYQIVTHSLTDYVTNTLHTFAMKGTSDLSVTPVPPLHGHQIQYRLQAIDDDLHEIDIQDSIGRDAILAGAGKSNLELMKIRLAPEIDFTKIYSLKVLIVGAGTLGCNVARGFLAWGVEYLTFIDNANVGASNLLRQSLFESSDLGQPKAYVARHRIEQIYPPSKGKVKGVQMNIPMPDHPDSITDLETNVKQLDDLIKGSDLVFLCTDNRESRWLPSLIACVHNKPLINLALGFDSYVVMRHPLTPLRYEVTFPKFESPLSGVMSEGDDHFELTPLTPPPPSLVSGPTYFSRHPGTSKFSDHLEVPRLGKNDYIDGEFGCSLTSLGNICIGSREIGSSYGSISAEVVPQPDIRLNVEEFGCYFCPSIEGVRNSVKDQALDERCTVTRGGVSMICSALGVELAISLVVHKNGFYAYGGKNCQLGEEHSLGKRDPPQQIRGNLKDFSTEQYLVKRNKKCVCCSEKVRQYYEDAMSRFSFLEDVCHESSLLQSINGDQGVPSQAEDMVSME